MGANTQWVVDITYIRTGEGWLCLGGVLDLFSDKRVGGSMSTVQDRLRVLNGVLMACWQRPDRRPVILHSDRGTQFTSADYQQFLKDHHLAPMAFPTADTRLKKQAKVRA